MSILLFVLIIHSCSLYTQDTTRSVIHERVLTGPSKLLSKALTGRKSIVYRDTTKLNHADTAVGLLHGIEDGISEAVGKTLNPAPQEDLDNFGFYTVKTPSGTKKVSAPPTMFATKTFHAPLDPYSTTEDILDPIKKAQEGSIMVPAKDPAIKAPVAVEETSQDPAPPAPPSQPQGKREITWPGLKKASKIFTRSPRIERQLSSLRTKQKYYDLLQKKQLWFSYKQGGQKELLTEEKLEELLQHNTPYHLYIQQNSQQEPQLISLAERSILTNGYFVKNPISDQNSPLFVPQGFLDSGNELYAKIEPSSSSIKGNYSQLSYSTRHNEWFKKNNKPYDPATEPLFMQAKSLVWLLFSSGADALNMTPIINAFSSSFETTVKPVAEEVAHLTKNFEHKVKKIVSSTIPIFDRETMQIALEILMVKEFSKMKLAPHRLSLIALFNNERDQNLFPNSLPEASPAPATDDTWMLTTFDLLGIGEGPRAMLQEAMRSQSINPLLPESITSSPYGYLTTRFQSVFLDTFAEQLPAYLKTGFLALKSSSSTEDRTRFYLKLFCYLAFEKQDTSSIITFIDEISYEDILRIHAGIGERSEIHPILRKVTGLTLNNIPLSTAAQEIVIINAIQHFMLNSSFQHACTELLFKKKLKNPFPFIPGEKILNQIKENFASFTTAEQRSLIASCITLMLPGDSTFPLAPELTHFAPSIPQQEQDCLRKISPDNQKLLFALVNPHFDVIDSFLEMAFSFIDYILFEDTSVNPLQKAATPKWLKEIKSYEAKKAVLSIASAAKSITESSNMYCVPSDKYFIPEKEESESKSEFKKRKDQFLFAINAAPHHFIASPLDKAKLDELIDTNEGSLTAPEDYGLVFGAYIYVLRKGSILTQELLAQSQAAFVVKKKSHFQDGSFPAGSIVVKQVSKLSTIPETQDEFQQWLNREIRPTLNEKSVISVADFIHSIPHDIDQLPLWAEHYFGLPSIITRLACHIEETRVSLEEFLASVKDLPIGTSAATALDATIQTELQKSSKIKDLAADIVTFENVRELFLQKLSRLPALGVTLLKKIGESFYTNKGELAFPFYTTSRHIKPYYQSVRPFEQKNFSFYIKNESGMQKISTDEIKKLPPSTKIFKIPEQSLKAFKEVSHEDMQAFSQHFYTQENRHKLTQMSITEQQTLLNSARESVQTELKSNTDFYYNLITTVEENDFHAFTELLFQKLSPRNLPSYDELTPEMLLDISLTGSESRNIVPFEYAETKIHDLIDLAREQENFRRPIKTIFEGNNPQKILHAFEALPRIYDLTIPEEAPAIKKIMMYINHCATDIIENKRTLSPEKLRIYKQIEPELSKLLTISKNIQNVKNNTDGANYIYRKIEAKLEELPTITMHNLLILADVILSNPLRELFTYFAKPLDLYFNQDNKKELFSSATEIVASLALRSLSTNESVFPLAVQITKLSPEALAMLKKELRKVDSSKTLHNSLASVEKLHASFTNEIRDLKKVIRNIESMAQDLALYKSAPIASYEQAKKALEETSFEQNPEIKEIVNTFIYRYLRPKTKEEQEAHSEELTKKEKVVSSSIAGLVDAIENLEANHSALSQNTHIIINKAQAFSRLDEYLLATKKIQRASEVRTHEMRLIKQLSSLTSKAITQSLQQSPGNEEGAEEADDESDDAAPQLDLDLALLKEKQALNFALKTVKESIHEHSRLLASGLIQDTSVHIFSELEQAISGALAQTIEDQKGTIEAIASKSPVPYEELDAAIDQYNKTISFAFDAAMVVRVFDRNDAKEKLNGFFRHKKTLMKKAAHLIKRGVLTPDLYILAAITNPTHISQVTQSLNAHTKEYGHISTSLKIISDGLKESAVTKLKEQTRDIKVPNSFAATSLAKKAIDEPHSFIPFTISANPYQISFFALKALVAGQIHSVFIRAYVSHLLSSIRPHTEELAALLSPTNEKINAAAIQRFLKEKCTYVRWNFSLEGSFRIVLLYTLVYEVMHIIEEYIAHKRGNMKLLPEMYKKVATAISSRLEKKQFEQAELNFFSVIEHDVLPILREYGSPFRIPLLKVIEWLTGAKGIVEEAALVIPRALVNTEAHDTTGATMAGRTLPYNLGILGLAQMQQKNLLAYSPLKAILPFARGKKIRPPLYDKAWFKIVKALMTGHFVMKNLEQQHQAEILQYLLSKSSIIKELLNATTKPSEMFASYAQKQLESHFTQALQPKPSSTLFRMFGSIKGLKTFMPFLNLGTTLLRARARAALRTYMLMLIPIVFNVAAPKKIKLLKGFSIPLVKILSYFHITAEEEDPYEKK